jgi:hypothetical protein
VKDLLLFGAWDRRKTLNAGKFEGENDAADPDSEGKEDGIDAEDSNDEDDKSWASERKRATMIDLCSDGRV